MAARHLIAARITLLLLAFSLHSLLPSLNSSLAQEKPLDVPAAIYYT
jgi:hypothetical protein